MVRTFPLAVVAALALAALPAQAQSRNTSDPVFDDNAPFAGSSDPFANATDQAVQPASASSTAPAAPAQDSGAAAPAPPPTSVPAKKTPDAGFAAVLGVLALAGLGLRRRS